MLILPNVFFLTLKKLRLSCLPWNTTVGSKAQAKHRLLVVNGSFITMELEFSKKYDAEHAQHYLQKHDAGIRRKVIQPAGNCHS